MADLLFLAGNQLFDPALLRDYRNDTIVMVEDASLCAMGGMTPFPVRSVLKYFAEDFASAVGADS